MPSRACHQRGDGAAWPRCPTTPAGDPGRGRRRGEPVSGDPLIQTTGLSKSYGRAVALRDLDLGLEPGEVFGYLGPNGAGKTTTLRLLVGLLRPTRGSARVCGHDSWRESAAVRRVVGFLSGEPALYPHLTARQHVE